MVHEEYIVSVVLILALVLAKLVEYGRAKTICI